MTYTILSNQAPPRPAVRRSGGNPETPVADQPHTIAPRTGIEAPGKLAGSVITPLQLRAGHCPIERPAAG